MFQLQGTHFAGHTTMTNLSPLASYWRFILAGFTKPLLTGTVIPSQRFLIDKMIEPIPSDWSGSVLELGAGIGTLTLRLAARCPSAQILACEKNPVLAGDLRRRLKGAGFGKRVKIVAEPAQRLLSEFAEKRSSKPAYIISGIPLANMDQDETDSLIDSIAEALPEGGIYIQFQYSVWDRKKIQARFPMIQTVPVWLNLPPAFIYYARKHQG